ncbi:natterin-3-like [Papaver somniferum]|uniref:natterin-3-like n=1 Tax=Papaver somniferum TaxID=3469 RepID=UPI000E6F70B5|nr:natterin-3-like [Papaver somniferum]
MDFNHNADNSSSFDYEVSPCRNGGIRLKSTAHLGTYWKYMADSSWVLLKQASTTVHDCNTVFLPTKLGDNRIIMKCLENGKYCNRHENCLATLNTWPDDWSTMEIEEPVISRKIDNVRYHFTDGRRYDEKTVALITDDSINRTRHPLTSEINLKTTVSDTTNWSNSVGLKVGVEMSIAASVPLVSEASFTISTEVSGSWDWGETQTKSQEVGSVRTIIVPPMTILKASLMATRCSCDVPYSYTQRDVLKNGSTKVSEKNDGLFTAHNGYGYQYEVVELPLE